MTTVARVIWIGLIESCAGIAFQAVGNQAAIYSFYIIAKDPGSYRTPDEKTFFIRLPGNLKLLSLCIMKLHHCLKATGNWLTHPMLMYKNLRLR